MYRFLINYDLKLLIELCKQEDHEQSSDISILLIDVVIIYMTFIDGWVIDSN